MRAKPGFEIMNTRRSQLYLAHARPDQEFEQGRCDGLDNAAEIKPEDAAEYIASLLGSLRCLALNAKFPLLCDLISVAEEEARFHCGT